MDKLKEAWNRRAGTTCELRCESRGGGRMISDTERRDVARRLRDQECKHKWRNQIMNDEKRNEVSSKLMDAAKCVSKDNIGCILNDALHGEEKLSGINEDCSVCCSVSLAELADLIKPSCDRDALLALADSIEEAAACKGEYDRSTATGYARRIRKALGVPDERATNATTC